MQSVTLIIAKDASASEKFSQSSTAQSSSLRPPEHIMHAIVNSLQRTQPLHLPFPAGWLGPQACGAAQSCQSQATSR